MYVIGIDVGTTNTKALVIRDDGKIMGKGSMGYQLYTEGNKVEQNAADWWKATKFAVREATKGIDKASISAISLSTQGATMLAIDEDNKPIKNALTWMDNRSGEQTEQIKAALGEDYVYQTTGWRLIPSADASKILYMKQNAEYKGAKKFISTIEYMNLKLTGRAVIDPTNAGIRQLFNVSKGTWDENILNAIHCTPDELPEILPSGEFVGTLLRESAEELGLSEKVKVFNGAHDQFCASIGSGAVNAGDMLISTGTTWVILSVARKPLFTSTYIASCTHPVQGLYGNLVSLTGTGSSFAWVKNSFFAGEDFQQINQDCEKLRSQKKGLFYIPWPTGAFYPYWIPEARAGFVGVDLLTDKLDFAVAVMEAAAFYVKAAIEDFTSNGCDTKSLRIMGGATKSDLWMGILKSVLDIPIQKMSVADTCAVGAASIALCASGCFADFEQTAAALNKGEFVKEAGFSTKYYQEKYADYQKIIKNMIKLYKND